MHPYKNLEEKFFWSTAVAQKNMFDISELWDPKFPISHLSKVITFGSCFAQHIGRALQKRGFRWLITEPNPFQLNREDAVRFNYDVFSSRTGNIYTVTLLKQWVSWATGETRPPDEIWEYDGRFYDPFRPNIEPNGFSSPEEMVQSREMAIEAFRIGLTSANVFVFTLGLTESWFNREYGYEYPLCPGTVVGLYDESQHKFVNQSYTDIYTTMAGVIRLIKNLNPRIKFLLTVSPVPLTATMSGNHVLVATMESKSTLRAVAGSLRNRFAFVDYFPSYEIINATPYRGTFFEPNQRNVNHGGVDHVMAMFFDGLADKFPNTSTGARPAVTTAIADYTVNQNLATKSAPTKRFDKVSQEDVVCEEELLNAFAKKDST
jgi:hypothetical protein